jgi:hypothetical protein
VRAARLIYSEIGAQVRAAGCRVSAGRAVVSGRRKLLAVARASRELFTAPGSPVRWPQTLWEYQLATGYVGADSITLSTRTSERSQRSFR